MTSAADTSPAALLAAATEAMTNAYAPYSHYKVGAALLTADGRIYTGCNIENSSFTPTCCAERVALFKAVSEGVHDFTAIAVVGGHEGKITGVFPPCGVCRQVLAEFCGRDGFVIYMGTVDGGYERYTLAELLPHGFDRSAMTAD